MTYVDEAIGITRAAAAAGLPAVISFTVETDGRLPSGQPLGEAIEQVDAETDAGPRLLHDQLRASDPLRRGARPGGAVGGADPRRAGERLDDEPRGARRGRPELDDGDPDDLGARYVALAEKLPNLNVLGGCCGTDDRHVAAIGAAWRRAGR